LNVTVIGGLEVARVRRDEVEVVVDTSFSICSVDVKLNVASEQVEGLLSMNATISLDGPTLTVPLAAADTVVILRWTVQLA
jgi:hypothetical protein